MAQQSVQVNDVVIEVRGLTKVFPGVVAVDNVSISFKRGKIYGLIGENGAGKSTLIKMLVGVEKPTKGEIRINGRAVAPRSPIQAEEELGIAVVFQEDVAIPLLSVAENLFLGRENLFYRNGVISTKKLYKAAEEILKNINLKIDVKKPIQELTVAERKLVSLARALSKNPRVLILDETTAPLERTEVEALFELLRKLKERGVTIIFVSHRLREILEICDEIIVMKDGKVVGVLENKALAEERLIEMMTGMKRGITFPEKAAKIGKTILSIKNLSVDNVLKNISLDLREGEIVALAGLRGQGQEILLQALYGLESLTSGEIYLNGRKLDIKSPLDAIRHGIIYVSDKRDYEELWPSLSILKNVSMASLKNRSKFGVIQFSKEKRDAVKMVSKLAVDAPSLDKETMYLSGGNKQKVALAKWLLTSAKVMLLNKPTEGIDVATKMDIYKLLRELANQGIAILTVLTELSEVINLPDRILVMREGKIIREFKGGVSESELLGSYYGRV